MPECQIRNVHNDPEPYWQYSHYGQLGYGQKPYSATLPENQIRIVHNEPEPYWQYSHYGQLGYGQLNYSASLPQNPGEICGCEQCQQQQLESANSPPQFSTQPISDGKYDNEDSSIAYINSIISVESDGPHFVQSQLFDASENRQCSCTECINAVISVGPNDLRFIEEEEMNLS